MNTSGKRCLSSQWEKYIKKLHHNKLKNMKPTMEIVSPPSFLHLRNRKKKEQQLEGKK
jgi:hypothetical protein